MPPLLGLTIPDVLGDCPPTSADCDLCRLIPRCGPAGFAPSRCFCTSCLPECARWSDLPELARTKFLPLSCLVKFLPLSCRDRLPRALPWTRFRAEPCCVKFRAEPCCVKERPDSSLTRVRLMADRFMLAQSFSMASLTPSPLGSTGPPCVLAAVGLASKLPMVSSSPGSAMLGCLISCIAADGELELSGRELR